MRPSPHILHGVYFSKDWDSTSRLVHNDSHLRGALAEEPEEDGLGDTAVGVCPGAPRVTLAVAVAVAVAFAGVVAVTAGTFALIAP